jgi:hypothetical protein
LFARAHTFVQTNDFYGLLSVPFVSHPHEDVVTVDVGDSVELVDVEAGSSQARRANR